MRVFLIGILAALLLPASAQALTLRADRPATGWIGLTASDTADATHVSFSEAGQQLADAAPSGGGAAVAHAAIWRCDRLARTFVATATYPDGSTQTAQASITTPSCRKRFALAISRTHIRIGDRWKVGGASVESCIRAPGRASRCTPIVVSARGASRKVGARATGVWTVALDSRHGQRLRRSFYVRPRGALRLLATGDSMIQIVDSYLKDRLARHRIRVRSDARISTGLSKPFLLNWPSHAKRQARGLRPDVTVVFIGANDGFSFGSVDCCGDKWVDAYAERVRTMMRAYSRGGRSLVYWLTLPAPRPAQWRPIYPAVNRAIKRAAASFGGAVRVLDIAKTFTPGYRFRTSMTWHGRHQTVRQPDGVHLSPAGASIAETLVERALRKDGAL